MIKKISCCFLSFCTVVLFSAVATHKAYGDTTPKQADVVITAVVPETTVTFSGFAAASSTVTIKEGVATVGTTVTNPSGVFSRTIISSPGLHDFSLYYTDTSGRTTPETFFN